MWKNRRIESQPEFVPEADIDEARYINEEMLKARLQDESNLLRESVYRKLNQYSTPGKEVTWAVFRLMPKNYESGLMTLSSETEVLIQLIDGYFDRNIDGKKVPIIRIVTNETYPIIKDGEEDEDFENCLAIDFSLDELDNAQINIDYASQKEYDEDYDEDEVDENSTVSAIIEEDMVHDPDYVEPEYVIQSSTPMFWVTSKGSLDSYRLLPLVPTLSVSAKLDDGAEQTVAPFGDITNISDQLDAISMAKQILQEVLTCDPIYNSAEVL